MRESKWRGCPIRVHERAEKGKVPDIMMEFSMKTNRRNLTMIMAGIMVSGTGYNVLQAAAAQESGAPDPGLIGARYSWTTYPAERARFNGTLHGPSRQYGTPEAEALGRQYVRLDKEGEYVEFRVQAPANSIVVRYCIPDAPGGGGGDASLGLYINGHFIKRLHLTSRYAWNYGDYPWTNDPSAGNPHHFFDETHAFLPAVKAGDVILLRKDVDDEAEYYLIDFIELEQVGPPLPRPDNSLSIEDFGSLRECIDASRTQGKSVWIPPGEFRIDGPRLHVGGVKVQGAGMWYSTLTGPGAMFEGNGEPVVFSDLAVFGGITHRDNESPDNAFNGNLGDGSVFSNLWIEHVKCGFWTTHGTKNMTVRNSRIRNVMADGLNFCDGTSHSTVENCHLRNTGDDALASWSPTGDWSSKKPCVGNRFVRNTVEQPWLANGIAVYGGADHLIAGNEIRETVISGAGILVSSGFEAVPFSGTIRVDNNRIEGAGGDCYIGDTIGGLWMYAKDSNVDAVIAVRGIDIRDSSRSGITLHGPKTFKEVRLDDVTVDGASEYGVHLKPGSAGVLRMGRFACSDTKLDKIRNDGEFEIIHTREK